MIEKTEIVETILNFVFENKYLIAKKLGGKLILRVEDTDLGRIIKGSQKYIEESLEWSGITLDESPAKGGNYGPYNQSERKKIYKQHVDKLIEKGSAYYAFDTKEELEAHRKNHELKGKTFIYNSHNRHKLKNSLTLSGKELEEKINEGDYVIRFKTAENRVVNCKDLIRGNVSISTKEIDDKILFKSDGMPTYHLANVVDDHLMKISHVVRGEEWLPSLALHVLLYEAFEWDAPLFAHLPLILKPTGKGKLSKRDGAKFGFPVYPLNWEESEVVYKGFREEGYLPEALKNYLAFLGWSNDKEKEVYKMYDEALAEEKRWATYLFSQGSMIGLSEKLLHQFVEYMANRRMKAIQLTPAYDQKVNPLPWVDHWLNSRSTQNAPQETEIESYVMGGIKQDVKKDQFKKFKL